MSCLTWGLKHFPSGLDAKKASLKVIHQSVIIPLWIFCCPRVTSNVLFLKELKQKLPALFCFQASSIIFRSINKWVQMYSRSCCISPMNNIIDEYYWYSDPIKRNDWHIISLLTHYSQVKYKRVEPRHQKNVRRPPPFLSLPPPPRLLSELDFSLHPIPQLGASSQAITTLLTDQNVSLKKLLSEFNHSVFLQLNVLKLGRNSFQYVLDTSWNCLKPDQPSGKETYLLHFHAIKRRVLHVKQSYSCPYIPFESWIRPC